MNKEINYNHKIQKYIEELDWFTIEIDFKISNNHYLFFEDKFSRWLSQICFQKFILLTTLFYYFLFYNQLEIVDLGETMQKWNNLMNTMAGPKYKKCFKNQLYN